MSGWKNGVVNQEIVYVSSMGVAGGHYVAAASQEQRQSASHGETLALKRRR